LEILLTYVAVSSFHFFCENIGPLPKWTTR
jgi:hypothetical protein